MIETLSWFSNAKAQDWPQKDPLYPKIRAFVDTSKSMELRDILVTNPFDSPCVGTALSLASKNLPHYQQMSLAI